MKKSMSKKMESQTREKAVEEKSEGCCGGSGGCGGACGCKKGIGNGCGGCAYILGVIGAAIYYVGQSSGFWAGTLGVLKALVWPAFVVYDVLKFIGT